MKKFLLSLLLSLACGGALAAPINQVDLQAFGAKCDGSTDDTVAIQKAISATTTGIIRVPLGTCVTGQLALKSNVSIEGYGWGSILKLKNSGNNYLLANTNGALYVDNVQIRNLAIDGNKTNNTSGGCIVMNGRNLAVSGVYCYEAANACMNFGAGSNGATDTPLAGAYRITNNYCKNNGKSGAAYPSLAVTHGSNIIISDNTVESTDGFMNAGIDLEPNAGNTIDQITINNNIVKGGRIFIDGNNLAGGATNVNVVGNRIDARGSDGPTGVNIATVFVRKVTGLNIIGNDMQAHVDAVRSCIHVESALTNFSFIGNKCIAQLPAVGSGYGFHFNNVASVATNGLIQNNTMIAAEAVNYAIYSINASGLVNVKIGTNYFTGFTANTFLLGGVESLVGQAKPGVSADNGDAGATLSHLSYSTQLWNTAITANRTIGLNRQVDDPQTLPGHRVRVVRGAGATGAFNLNVGGGPLKAMGAASTWCDFAVKQDGTWILEACGTL